MKGAESNFFKNQNFSEKKYYESSENQAIKSRVENINENYAKKILDEIHQIPKALEFVEEVFEKSFVEDAFNEEELYGVLADKENSDQEIEIPNFRKIDTAVVGKIIMLWKEKLEMAH